ncbi:MAG TPA: DNA mismatch repair endonuclease MutL [Methylomirabilota bacterium]
MRIRKLPDALVNKIAAGEVVERPASAVKELVENALDAGAGAVTVDLRDGGAALVRVGDDGHGMTAAELPVALERHATSKLATDEDLEAIATLGFRGEALAAICAVSRFTVTSRAREAAQGLRLAGEGGAVSQHLSVPAEVGTTVEVHDLFFNTPARLKFMKAASTELAASLRIVGQLALAHPAVRFRVSNNGRAALTAPAAAGLRERVGALWSWQTAERLLAVDRLEHGVRVAGWASPPDLTRGGRDDIVLIVNGRPVRDPALSQAVLAAYRPLLPRDRFPLVVLAVTLAPADVDVNVHPTKAWVRFRQPRVVQEMLVAALHEALRRPSVVPALGAEPRWPAGVEPAAGGAAPAAQPGLFQEAAAPYAARRFGRVLGQVQDTFIVSTTEDEVFFLDQHVVHERVIFEQIRAQLAAGPLPSQALLFAQALELGPASRARLERWRAPLERLGFAFEGFGGDAVVLRAVPTLLEGDEPRRLVEAAVEELADSKAGEPALDRALAFVACRAAVKANTPLAPEEMDRLVGDLEATETPYFCPHGRPIMSRVSMQDIRRELKRTW